MAHKLHKEWWAVCHWVVMHLPRREAAWEVKYAELSPCQVAWWILYTGSSRPPANLHYTCTHSFLKSTAEKVRKGSFQQLLSPISVLPGFSSWASLKRMEHLSYLVQHHISLDTEILFRGNKEPSFKEVRLWCAPVLFSVLNKWFPLMLTSILHYLLFLTDGPSFTASALPKSSEDMRILDPCIPVQSALTFLPKASSDNAHTRKCVSFQPHWMFRISRIQGRVEPQGKSQSGHDYIAGQPFWTQRDSLEGINYNWVMKPI